MSRDYRDQRGGHKTPPKKQAHACGCCFEDETYKRKDGGHLSRSARKRKVKKILKNFNLKKC